MHQQLIQSIVEEIRAGLTSKFLGKIFQLTPLSFVIDLGIRGKFLLLDLEPSSPRLYLTQRRVRDLEKQSLPLSHFGQLMKAQLGGGHLVAIDKDKDERIVRLSFRIEDELGVVSFRRLLAQLTGRAANLFILDELNRITTALRPPKGVGQQPGQYYVPPPGNEPARREPGGREPTVVIDGSPSMAAEEYFTTHDKERDFERRVSDLRGQTKKALDQKTKLRDNLEKDLSDHGDPEAHKRLGDLLLANVSTASREANKVRITDFYADGAPTIEIEIDDNTSLQEAASRSFRQYSKAKRAREEIVERLATIKSEIAQFEERLNEIDRIAREQDEAALSASEPQKKQRPSAGKREAQQQLPGVRRYLSTDGFEILVGRGARDNDNLTFRIARPSDLWLHAGDYPGSHVVVRNPNRNEIPQRTIIEAAQLAGRFSQASEDSKVVIHYTERKFLSKPKGAAPGLVRMSSFRSITVEPKESVARL